MGRMVCEGSNLLPLPKDSPLDEFPTITVVYPNGNKTIFHVSLDREMCGKCQRVFKPLKSGKLPKHTRYVSYVEQQASWQQAEGVLKSNDAELPEDTIRRIRGH